LNFPRNARVLDIGCGNGGRRELLAQKARDGRVVGIDIATNGSDCARQFLVIRKRRVSHSEPEQLPFAMVSLRSVLDGVALLLPRHNGGTTRNQTDAGAGWFFVAVLIFNQENVPSHSMGRTVESACATSEYRGKYRAVWPSAGFVM